MVLRKPARKSIVSLGGGEFPVVYKSIWALIIVNQFVVTPNHGGYSERQDSEDCMRYILEPAMQLKSIAWVHEKILRWSIESEVESIICIGFISV